MTSPSVGALLGLLAGLGVVLLASWRGARRPMTIAARIAPFVGHVGARSVVRPSGAVTLVSGLLRPTPGRVAAPPSRSLDARLAAAGEHRTPSEYRLERMGWAVAGAGVGILVGAALAAHGSSTSGVPILALLGAVAGWWSREVALGRRVRRRRASIELHLPVLADLAALAVTAGAPPMTALERAASCMNGPLADEIARAVADVRGGSGTEAALRAMAGRAVLPALHRFVEGLITALERGTPIADLLRAQADDVRAAEGRRLMELAGRKDVAMLVPIVFLVLPSVVLIAIYPGVQSLALVVP